MKEKTTLHFIHTQDHQVISDTIQHCNASDAIILLNEAVYWAQKKSNPQEQSITDIKPSLYVLTSDIQLRGLGDCLQDVVQQISTDNWVDLTTQFDKLISW